MDFAGPCGARLELSFDVDGGGPTGRVVPRLWARVQRLDPPNRALPSPRCSSSLHWLWKLTKEGWERVTPKATTPTRFDAALFESAQAAGSRTHRSAAQQLAHWARLGRELEAASGLSQRDIDRVLAGQLCYDDIAERDQASVRTTWREGVDADLASFDLRGRFEAQGRTRWSEADEQGNVIVHETSDDDAGVPAGTAAARKRRAP